MLDVDNQRDLVVPEWNLIPEKAALPTREFLSRNGPMPVKPGSSRGYHRQYLRTKAVARWNGIFLAVYLSDISRSGVAIYSPIQILPCEPIEVWLPNGKQFRLKNKVCQREKEKCYRCGMVFTDS